MPHYNDDAYALILAALNAGTYRIQSDDVRLLCSIAANGIRAKVIRESHVITDGNGFPRRDFEIVAVEMNRTGLHAMLADVTERGDTAPAKLTETFTPVPRRPIIPLAYRASLSDIFATAGGASDDIPF